MTELPRRFRPGWIALSLLLLVAFSPPPAVGEIDPELAAKVFAEAEAVCRKDGGELWGVSICGPLLLVDPESRRVVANRKGYSGSWQQEGQVWSSHLPSSQPAANTRIAWAGLEWAMLVWPLPEDPVQRTELVAHESWHRIQRALGIPERDPPNAHLDTLEGRHWLLLELRALATALVREGEEREAAIRDALAFRQRRRELFPEAAEEERALELHEGLAAYTGIRFAQAEGAEPALAQGLAEAQERSSLVRTFAYGSGPAYGLLLDALRPGWRRELGAASDLSALLAGALEPGAQVDPDAASRRYGGAVLFAKEQARESVRKERVAEIRARLVDGPILVLPLGAMQIKFDPSEVLPIPGEGTAYLHLQINDRWGVLSVQSFGALVASDSSRVQVVAPAETAGPRIEGPGWTLELAPGWRISASGREGRLIVEETGG